MMKKKKKIDRSCNEAVSGVGVDGLQNGHLEEEGMQPRPPKMGKRHARLPDYQIYVHHRLTFRTL